MNDEQIIKNLHNFLIDIYGGLYYKKDNDLINFYSRRFEDKLIIIDDGELKFKDELLYNSLPQLINIGETDFNSLIINYFKVKFNLQIKKIIA